MSELYTKYRLGFLCLFLFSYFLSLPALGKSISKKHTHKEAPYCLIPVTFSTQPGATACINTDVTYTTQSGLGQNNYAWVVPGTLGIDYSITSGGIGTSSATVTLKWLTTGTKTVTINYASITGCTQTAPTSSTPTAVLSPALSAIPSTGNIANYRYNNNANDATGTNQGTFQNGPTVITDRFGYTNAAFSFNGTNQYMSTAVQYTNPTDFTYSIWFKTTVAGGMLIGFGDAQIGQSGTYDRHIYMNNAGQVYFGVYPGSVKTINSTASYNDGAWHMATASLSATNGIKLYMDGALVSSDATTKTAQSYSGYIKVAFDNLGGWTSQPSNFYFTGSLDDILVYNKELTAAQVSAIYTATNGATSNGPVCAGSAINLSATNISGATYSWTGPNGFTSTSRTPTIATSVAANAGIYIVSATLAPCTAPGIDSVSVVVSVSPTAYTVTGTGSYCSGNGGLPVGVSNSQVGVTYQLLLGSTNMGSPIAGTGSAISFGNQITGGTYTVVATNLSNTSCTKTMTGSAVITMNSAQPVISQIPASGNIANYRYSGNANDATGTNQGTFQNNPTATADRFGNANSAYSFDGSTQYMSTAIQYNNPTDFTLSIWFKTTTTTGGKLIGFGNAQTGSSGQYDRHIYMNNAGQIYFGIYNAGVKVLNSTASYNDGTWHLATASLSSTNGMKLYIDGVLLQSDPTSTLAENHAGYWRVAYDNVNSWTSQPSSFYFNGSLDDILIYSRELTASEVATVYNSPDGAGSNSPIICSNSPINLTATLISGASYAWTGPNGFTSTSRTPSIATAAGNAGTYTVQVTSGTCTTPTIASTIVVVTPGANFTWLGVDNNWNNSNNWCGGIPTSTTNIIIPGSLSNYPILAAGKIDSVNNMTIQSGGSITINGTLSIYGAITSSGSATINAVNGTIKMAGSAAQSITGANFTSYTINNLIDSNSNTTTGLSVDTINITGQLGFPYTAGSKLTITQNVSLMSNATGTAWVGPMAVNGSFVALSSITAGKVTVQRYFPQHRRWRFVTAPLSSVGAPTINASWQEGGVSTGLTAAGNQNPHSPYGTHITGPSHTTYTTGKGYDQSPTNSASIAYISGLTSWFALPNTNVTKVTDYPGYMLFARGARDYAIWSTTTTVNATPATLRATGTLKTGRQTTTFSAAGLVAVGNPYAATINYSTIYPKSSGVGNSPSFYLWAPNRTNSANIGTTNNDYGGWVAMTYVSGNNFTAVPDPNSLGLTFDKTGNIQSGSAFLVNASGAGSLVIDESDKITTATSNGETYLFRPTGDATNEPVLFRSTLIAVKADSSVNYMADGVLNLFDNSYSNAVDVNKDLPKVLNNVDENLGIKTGSQLLTIQRRSIIEAGDSIHLSMSGLHAQLYRFDFAATNFSRPDLLASLVDKYANTSTAVKLGNDSTSIIFKVDGTAPSVATDRFSIAFRYAPGTATYSSITAVQQNKNIAVQWIVTNQLNIKKYVVEKSVDGTNFYPVDTTIATGDTTSVSYNFLDEHAVVGTNYYRVRSVDNSGASLYSPIVSVVIGKGIIAGIAIYPNPVINGVLQLQMNNVTEGNYDIKIMDESGQVMLQQTISHGSTSENHPIIFGNGMAKGMYILKITNPDKSNTTINFENQ